MAALRRSATPDPTRAMSQVEGDPGLAPGPGFPAGHRRRDPGEPMPDHPAREQGEQGQQPQRSPVDQLAHRLQRQHDQTGGDEPGPAPQREGDGGERDGGEHKEVARGQRITVKKLCSEYASRNPSELIVEGGSGCGASSNSKSGASLSGRSARRWNWPGGSLCWLGA